MGLQGFSIAQYIGWVSGILFLKSPKGPPTVPLKKSLHSIYALVIFLLITSMWIDFHIRHLQVLQKETSVEKFLSCSLFFGATIFDLFFRSCFFFRAKLIARFLKTLETDMNKMFPFQRIPPDDRKTWKSYRNLIMIVHIYHSLGALLMSLWVAELIPEDTAFLGFISGSVYPVLFLFFGAIPLVSSCFVSFAFVVVTTLHIQWIFEDFCLYFENQIAHHETKVLNPMQRDLGEIYSIPVSKSGNDQILSKFEHLKMLTNLYDKTCGPLLMGLLVRAVFTLISAANSILLYNGGKRMKLAMNVYYFVMEVTQLVLLQLGYMTQRRLSERKEQLHRKVILMTNLEPKDQLKESIDVVTAWDWTISGGPGFFDVDRPLLSGVLSSLMTYVTILFQLSSVADEIPGSFQEAFNVSSTPSPISGTSGTNGT